MSFTIEPTQDQLTKALGGFIKDVLPSDVFVTVGSPNRVAEPKEKRFAVMQPIRFVRLSTNLDAYEDVKFTASSADGQMMVTDVSYGTIILGANVFAVDLPAATKITEQVSGDPGGVGTYAINSDTTLDQRVYAAGGFTLTQSSMVTVQIDFHSDDTTAAELAQIVSTAFRDTYGVEFFEALEAPLNKISPLYADDPKLRPFTNDQMQYEWLWVLDANLQIDQVLRAPMQYAELVEIGLVDVRVVSVDTLSLDYSKPDNSQYFPGL